MCGTQYPSSTHFGKEHSWLVFRHLSDVFSSSDLNSTQEVCSKCSAATKPFEKLNGRNRSEIGASKKSRFAFRSS